MRLWHKSTGGRKRKFEIGDAVVVSDPAHVMVGEVGRVTKYTRSSKYVTKVNGKKHKFFARQLKPLELEKR